MQLNQEEITLICEWIESLHEEVNLNPNLKE